MPDRALFPKARPGSQAKAKAKADVAKSKAAPPPPSASGKPNPTPEELKHRQQVFVTYLKDNIKKRTDPNKAAEAENVYERYHSSTDPEAKPEMVNSFELAGGKLKGLPVLVWHTP